MHIRVLFCEGELIAHKLDQSWNKFVYMYAGHDSMMILIPFLYGLSLHDASESQVRSFLNVYDHYIEE